jgi:hypothetical protein
VSKEFYNGASYKKSEHKNVHLRQPRKESRFSAFQLWIGVSKILVQRRVVGKKKANKFGKDSDFFCFETSTHCCPKENLSRRKKILNTILHVMTILISNN